GAEATPRQASFLSLSVRTGSSLGREGGRGGTMSARRFPAALAGTVAGLRLGAPPRARSPGSTLPLFGPRSARAPVRAAALSAAPRDARLLITRETDAAGEARFDDLVPGGYVIEVAAAGFAPAARAVAVRAGATRIAVALALSALTERILVTSTGHLQTSAEV